jgi:hypothetical protein
MLAADRSLLEINLRQSAIKLREKELTLFTNNFSAMATQAAVFAGFTTTCLIEIDLPAMTHPIPKACLHMCAVASICANITCVSLSTITVIWGNSKALRGKDGSMDEAVDGINAERALIFNTFAIGLAGNLTTVLFACIILMDKEAAFIAISTVLFTAYMIYSNAIRIQKKFMLQEFVKLDDLTKYHPAAADAAVNKGEQRDDLESNHSLLGKNSSGGNNGVKRY